MSSSDTPILRLRPSVKRLEAAAWRTLQKCRAELELDHVPVPIPVEEWIEHPLGYRFGVVRLINGVLGQAFIRDREIQISDRITHEGRFRFTCAHELGHQVLHRRVAKEFTDAGIMLAAPNRRAEWEADRFAAAFLLPIPLVVEHLFRLRDEFGISRDEMALLMQPGPRSLAMWRDRFVPSIASRFGVSREATVYRFGEIEFSDGTPLLPPEHREGLLTRTSAARRSSGPPPGLLFGK